VLGAELASVYRAVNWRQVARRGKRRLDVFEHRVKAAASQPTVPRFLEKLCHRLGLQSVEIPARLITALDRERDRVLGSLRRESIYWVLLAEREASGK